MKDSQIIIALQNILGDVAELQESREPTIEQPIEINSDEREDLLNAIIVLHQIYRRNR